MTLLGGVVLEECFLVNDVIVSPESEICYWRKTLHFIFATRSFKSLSAGFWSVNRHLRYEQYPSKFKEILFPCDAKSSLFGLRKFTSNGRYAIIIMINRSATISQIIAILACKHKTLNPNHHFPFQVVGQRCIFLEQKLFYCVCYWG